MNKLKKNICKQNFDEISENDKCNYNFDEHVEEKM